MTEPGAATLRPYLMDLLTRWREGTTSPAEMTAEARALWLSRAWPKSYEDGYDPIGPDVLYMLADARDLGLIDDDIPALIELLETPAGDEALGNERFGARFEALDDSMRETTQASDYYGPVSDDDVDSLEMGIGDPEQRRIHRAIRVDPASVWDDVRALMYAPPPRDEDFLLDIIEDLVFTHTDDFIDRLEELAAECPGARIPLATADVGGAGVTPAIERFRDLQDRLLSDLRADRLLY